MIDRFLGLIVSGLFATSIFAFAQSVTTPAAAIPRTPDGKPDLSGVYQIPYVPDMSRGLGELPYTPWGAENFKNYDATKFDYTAHCLPAGLTREMNTPFPLEIFQSPKKVVIIFEGFSNFVIIPIDGRDHPKKLEPTWIGNSVGRWEGDTLVVDSTGFNDKTRLDTIGHPHSEALHVIQRFQRTDALHLAYEVTVDDPVTYTRPWKNNRVFTLRPDWELMEYSCEENNKDVNEGHVK